MFILLQHLGLPTGAAIVVSIIVIKAVKAGLTRGPSSRSGAARDRRDRGPRR
jgi:hypothetical protein